MSLLTMTQQVCRRIGITAPVSVSSSSDPQIIQLMALANEEGQDLSLRYPWQALVNESTFATVATESQGTISTLAGTGFRYVLNNIMWDRTRNLPVCGPLSPQEWQQLKSQNLTGPYTLFRIRGGLLRFIPTPSAGSTIAFEWVSKNWVSVTASSTTSATWTADADTGLLDEEAMTQGMIWRWKSYKGLEYAEDYNKYERIVADGMARDGAKPALNMNGGYSGYPAGTLVPIGSWNL